MFYIELERTHSIDCCAVFFEILAPINEVALTIACTNITINHEVCDLHSAATALPAPPTCSSLAKAQSNALDMIEQHSLDVLEAVEAGSTIALSASDKLFLEALKDWVDLSEEVVVEKASPGASYLSCL
jgi:hypothetical protein